MKYVIISLLFAAVLSPVFSGAVTSDPIKPYSTRGGLPGYHRIAGYGAAHKNGVYTRNQGHLSTFTASPSKPTALKPTTLR